MKRLTFDFETRSESDLKRQGAYKYSRHPSTRATCLGIKEHGKGKQTRLIPFNWINQPWKTLPETFRRQWETYINDRWEFSAHNAFFELCIYNNILVEHLGWPVIPFELWRCTAAKAAHYGLPRSLEGSGAALGLSIQKDKQGVIAMMQTCKPTAAWGKWESLGRQGSEPEKFREPHNHAGIFTTLYHYCKMDVLAEEAVDDALPDLSETELAIWRRNLKQNWRGLDIEIDVVNAVIIRMENANKENREELFRTTLGCITKPGSRNDMLAFLASEGVELPDLKASTVRDAIKDGIKSDAARIVLDLRAKLTKSSNKKYYAFRDRTDHDGRARDFTLYHAASTGRSGGSGINPFNFPRGLIKASGDWELIDEFLIANDPAYFDKVQTPAMRAKIETASQLFYSAMLRNMICAGEGFELVAGDWSMIEVIILWWLAGNEYGLDMVRSGQDIYILQACDNTGKPYTEIKLAYDAKLQWGMDTRQLGKAQILGGGFGMGGTKFQTTAADQYGLELTTEASQRAIQTYRQSHAAVPRMWYGVEEAFKSAMRGKPVEFCKCKFYMETVKRGTGQFMIIEGPSGKKLPYLNPKVESHMTLNGPREQITFDAPAKDRKSLWREHTWGGKLTENIVQMTARELMNDRADAAEKSGFTILFDVYDELVTTVDARRTTALAELLHIMKTLPKWADEKLPLKASGWTGLNYKKG